MDYDRTSACVSCLFYERFSEAGTALAVVTIVLACYQLCRCLRGSAKKEKQKIDQEPSDSDKDDSDDTEIQIKELTSVKLLEDLKEECKVRGLQGARSDAGVVGYQRTA